MGVCAGGCRRWRWRGGGLVKGVGRMRSVRALSCARVLRSTVSRRGCETCSASRRTRGRLSGYSRARKASSRSRTRQRRSNASPERAADTRMRTCMARSVASVTCTTQTRPSHSGAALTTRSTSARSGSIGVAKSRYRNTVPRICELLRVQFSKGFSMNHCSGMISRRSSQSFQHHVGAGDLLDAAPLALDDQHVVHADRLGQRQLQAGDEVAEHGPGGDAATMPITPAEASRLAPTWRAPGKVISAMAVPARSPRPSRCATAPGSACGCAGLAGCPPR